MSKHPALTPITIAQPKCTLPCREKYWQNLNKIIPGCFYISAEIWRNIACVFLHLIHNVCFIHYHQLPESKTHFRLLGTRHTARHCWPSLPVVILMLFFVGQNVTRVSRVPTLSADTIILLVDVREWRVMWCGPYRFFCKLVSSTCDNVGWLIAQFRHLKILLYLSCGTIGKCNNVAKHEFKFKCCQTWIILADTQSNSLQIFGGLLFGFLNISIATQLYQTTLTDIAEIWSHNIQISKWQFNEQKQQHYSAS